MNRSEFMRDFEYGYGLPDHLMLNPYGKPLMSREEWEQLPRRRRWFDLVFGGYPPKRRPPPWERDAG